MTWHRMVCSLLIHLAIGGSLFLAAGWLALQRCRQPIRRIRLIELTLLGSLLVPLVGQLSLLPHWSAGWLDLTPDASSSTASDSVPPPSDGAGSTPWSAPAAAAAAPAESPRPAANVTIAAPPAVAEPVEASASVPATDESPSRLSLPLLILAVHGGGAAILLLGVGVGVMALLRLTWTATSVPPQVAGVFQRIAGPAGKRVRLLASEHVELPLAFQLGRPVIVLPARLCGEGDSEELRYGLAHEWSHIEQGDLWRWNLVTLASLVFFYQPVFWLLRRHLRLCQDYLADARAAEQADLAEDYASYLVAAARCRLRAPAAALGLGDRRSHLYRRITMLLHDRPPLERRCLRSWSLAAGLGTLALVLAFSAVRLDAGPAPKPASDARLKATTQSPGETLHYTGRVVDKDTGKAIAGATVTVRRSLLGDPEQKEHNPVVQETRHTTDAQGKYHFTIPSEQTAKRYLYIELDVEHLDYAPRKHFGYALSMIRKNEKIGGRPFFELVEMRAGKPITGIVQTPEGNPAAGVKLLAYSVTDKRSEQFEYGSFADTRTDAKGKFRLVLTTPGKAVLWVLPEKYAPSVHAVRNNKRGDLGIFTLKDGIRLACRVLDVRGKPLAGVNVNANTMEQSEELQGLPVFNAIARSAISDSDGKLTLAPLPPGSYQVQPDEHAYDDSRDDHSRHPLPDIFVGRKVTLKAGGQQEPLELRAVPHVIIEARYLDSKGKPTRGHDCTVYGQMDNMFWHTQGKAGPDGKFSIAVPHGLENARMQLMTNEHGVLRWRKSSKAPLQSKREVDLGTLNDDARGIEIIRYVAPILVVDAVDRQGQRIKDYTPQATYQAGKSPKDPNSFFVNGVKGDVYFEKQEDGRWHSHQMLPDEEVSVTAIAKAYQAPSEKVKLAEGAVKEIKLVLDKAPAEKK